jgi:hypothetical protein
MINNPYHGLYYDNNNNGRPPRQSEITHGQYHETITEIAEIVTTPFGELTDAEMLDLVWQKLEDLGWDLSELQANKAVIKIIKEREKEWQSQNRIKI